MRLLDVEVNQLKDVASQFQAVCWVSQSRRVVRPSLLAYRALNMLGSGGYHNVWLRGSQKDGGDQVAILTCPLGGLQTFRNPGYSRVT